MSGYDIAVILDEALPEGFVKNGMTYAHYVQQAEDWFCENTHGVFVMEHETLSTWHVDAEGYIVDDCYEKGKHYREDAGCTLIPVREIPDNFNPDALCWGAWSKVTSEDYAKWGSSFQEAVRNVLRDTNTGLVMVIRHCY